MNDECERDNSSEVGGRTCTLEKSLASRVLCLASYDGESRSWPPSIFGQPVSSHVMEHRRSLRLSLLSGTKRVRKGEATR
jgi:hypothetical protein